MTDGREVLILQHHPAEPPGLIGKHLTDRGLRVRTLQRFDREPVPDELDGVAGVVAMGGPQSAVEPDPALAAEIDLLVAAVEAGLPVLGVCLGSQLLAHALGADVGPGTTAEIGWLPIRLTDAALGDPLFGTVSEPLIPLHWHSDVPYLPDGATLLASSRHTPVQAFAGPPGVYGLLFHLEATLDIVRDMVDAFPDELAGAHITPPELLDDLPQHVATLEPAANRILGGWTELIATG